MEQKGTNGGGFGLPNPLRQLLYHISKDDSLVDFPPAVQRAENSVPDCDRHPGRLFWVDDWDQKLQQLSMPVDPAVTHRVSVLGVYLVHKSSLMVALHPVGQPGSSSRESVGVAPQVRGPELRAISDRPSNMFGRSGCNISRTSCSLFSAHGRSSSPSHLIRAKSCLSSSKWIGFSGMFGVTFRREIVLVYGGAILLLGLPDTECYTRKPSLGKLKSHYSAKLSRKGAENTCN